jgi:hypothetical protein
MKILQLLFSILNSIETDSLTVKQISALSQVAAAIIEGQTGSSIKNKIIALAKNLVEEAPRKREQTYQSDDSSYAGSDQQTDADAARQQAEEKARIKELKQLIKAGFKHWKEEQKELERRSQLGIKYLEAYKRAAEKARIKELEQQASAAEKARIKELEQLIKAGSKHWKEEQKELEKQAREAERARIKELEQMGETVLRQQLAEARTCLLAMKQVFAVLESNFYDRLAVYTPVDTGNLLSSLYAKHIGLFTIQIGFNTHQAPYAIYVHECLDYRHPNGGIAQFLMVAFTEAWMYTRVALNDYLNADSTLDDAIKKLIDRQLNGMNYTIDISKNKLAITISMLHDYHELNNMHLDELADSLEGSDAKEILEQQFKEYSQYVFNLSNTTKIPNANLRGLSPKAKKKFTLFSLYKRLDENGVSSQTARKRAERMENTAKSLYKTTEIYEQAAKIKLSSSEQTLVDDMLNANTDLSLAVRLSARERMNKKIIYPLILDQIDRQQRQAKQEAEKAAKDAVEDMELTDDDFDDYEEEEDIELTNDDLNEEDEDIEVVDDDFAKYQAQLQMLQPDIPADVEVQQSTYVPIERPDGSVFVLDI